ncbi:hypothetical protein NP493_147g01037 [Ridgeia piscesae]|uniref:NADH dehydrogenase [ubiquinone] 1 alpha subcomplex assembly factor 2 n=1 Tax=Ridgeia piscesae TaxID=27915 RepID=A0AAD9UG09_RIDPI|nr:hypothetical protein NP493_147g01037 [Ridgeia piscesae]
MPGKPAPGLFARILTNLRHRSGVRHQQEVFVGEDEHGNRYFERRADPSKDLKAQRRLEPRDSDQFKAPTVPVEWTTWLQHRRKEPPTTEEREQNYVKMIIIQQRAKELEEKRRMENPEPEKEEDITQINKNTAFPKYADYDEIIKKVEEGDDTGSKK